MSQPTDPQLRDQLVEALRTTPSVLMDTPEDRARHASNPRNHHIGHHYYWGCAMCRGEVGTLADAVLAVVRPPLDRRQEVLEVVNGQCRKAEAERDRAMASVPLVCSDDRHQAKVRGLEERAATAEADRDDARRDTTLARQHAEAANRRVGLMVAEVDRMRELLAAAALAPVEQPPGATVLECSSVLFRTFGGAGGHRSHTWEPQPGVTPVWCPGSTEAAP